VGHRFDLDSDVEQLLAELCIDLGFCLPPDEIRHLSECGWPGEEVVDL